MSKTEEQITRGLMKLVAEEFATEGVTLYEAVRILGYTLVALAEVLPEKLPLEHDGTEAK